MKKIFVIFLCLLSFTTINASVTTYDRTENDLRVHTSIEVNGSNKNIILNTPSVDESVKVYDFAELLSDSEEQKLYDKIMDYIDEFNMDMVIMTTDVNPRGNTLDYADDFYDYNYFGIGENFDGLLFIIDMHKREIGISTSGKAIIMYDDYRIDKILDEAYEYIANGNYFQTCFSFVDKSYSYAEAGIPDSNENVYIDDSGNLVEKEEVPYLGCLIGSAVITLIVMLIMIKKNKMVTKKADVHHNLVEETFKVENLGKRLVNTFTNRVRINTDTSSGGSSGSSRIGGSSFRSSSSGRSHGGGSRKF